MKIIQLIRNNRLNFGTLIAKNFLISYFIGVDGKMLIQQNLVESKLIYDKNNN